MKKRRFRWTLSKKIFIWIVVCFAVVELVHLNLDVQNEVNYVLDTMQQDGSKISTLVRNFYQNYNDIQDKSFLEKLKKNDSYGLQLLDKKFNLVDKKTYMGEDYDKPVLELFGYDDYGYEIQYIVDLSSVDEELLDLYEFSIEGNIINSANQKVRIAFTKSTDISSQFKFEKEKVNVLEIKDMDYLQINHHILIDNRVDDKKIIEPTFLSYTRSSYSTRQGSYAGDFTAVNYNHERDLVLNNIINKSDIQNEIFNTSTNVSKSDFELGIGYQEKYVFNESLYTANVLPLFSKDAQLDENVCFKIDVVLGYVLEFNVSPNSVSFIGDTVMKEKFFIYVISFIFAIQISVILSYMITRRIREMNKATQQIANNDFDIHLKETPKDELGELSENINVMNEHLKENMGQLTNEIEHVKKLESVRKEFIANFTHEIKTPLGIINGYIELMEEVKDEQKKEQYLAAINNETDRINELVLAMLDLTRLESENVELHIQDVDVEDCLTNILDSFESLLKKKNIRIDLQGESDTIQADLFEIQMVMKNFISNAIKHTPINGCIHIQIMNNRVSIENEGSYLTKQQLQSIWDTYVSSDREGTGLGLAI
ncbi:MAG: HAMP domain-containing sensor histidine kinase, partial [Coprobacillus sp.]